MDPHDQGGDVVTVTVFAVLGVGLLALFAGFDWFWLVFVLGFAVLVPAVAVLFGDEEENGARGGDGERDGNGQRGRRSRPWWDDLRVDDRWTDLSAGWTDPEHERARDREVRGLFGVPVAAEAGRANERSDGTAVAGERTGVDGNVDVSAALTDLRARYARGEVTDERFDVELDRLLAADGREAEPERA